jgi:CTP:molybdopterin cytidylyltransferase MocA/uncharacterized UPF0146 family protein
MQRRTAAVVLAAGLGTRFGGGKLLADINGKPMLQHVLDLAAAANLDPVVVVLGTDADELEAACTWRGELKVRNPDPARGISSSVRLGIEAVADSEATRAAMLVGDQPFLTSEQLRVILDQPGAIVVPLYEGKPGTPVVLGRDTWQLTDELTGDRGMSQLFDRYPDLVRYVDVPGTNPDLDTPQQIVAAGYDALGRRYAEWSAPISDPMRARLVDQFIARLPTGARVVDLGCGPGLGTTQQLAERFDVTAVDISAGQLGLARQNLPTATLIQADMTTLVFAPRSFDGVVALYSLSHLPARDQPEMLSRIHDWLRPDGLLLATLPANGGSDWTGEWLGVPMFFGGLASAADNTAALVAGGFELLVDEVVATDEPGGPVRFQWILALAR